MLNSICASQGCPTLHRGHAELFTALFGLCIVPQTVKSLCCLLLSMLSLPLADAWHSPALCSQGDLWCEQSLRDLVGCWILQGWVLLLLWAFVPHCTLSCSALVPGPDLPNPEVVLTLVVENSVACAGETDHLMSFRCSEQETLGKNSFWHSCPEFLLCIWWFVCFLFSYESLWDWYWNSSYKITAWSRGITSGFTSEYN